MADPTDNLDAVNQYIVDLYKAQADALGLTDVWYGEHESIPRTPCITVDPRNKRRQVANTGQMVRNDFQVTVTIFHSKLVGSQVVMKECLELAEAVEAVLHGDKKLGGLLVHSYVDQVATGYARRNKVVYKATELTWTGFSKTRI